MELSKSLFVGICNTMCRYSRQFRFHYFSENFGTFKNRMLWCQDKGIDMHTLNKQEVLSSGFFCELLICSLSTQLVASNSFFACHLVCVVLSSNDLGCELFLFVHYVVHLCIYDMFYSGCVHDKQEIVLTVKLWGKKFQS